MDNQFLILFIYYYMEYFMRKLWHLLYLSSPNYCPLKSEDGPGWGLRRGSRWGRKIKKEQAGEEIRNKARSVSQVHSPEACGVFLAQEEMSNGLRFLSTKGTKG